MRAKHPRETTEPIWDRLFKDNVLGATSGNFGSALRVAGNNGENLIYVRILKVMSSQFQTAMVTPFLPNSAGIA